LGVAVDSKTGFVSRNFFLVDGKKVWIIADPAHLIKNWRNGLVSYDFLLSDEVVEEYQLPSNRVSFKHIIEVAKFQRGSKWKYASHLPEEFFLHDNFHFDKMNVQNARKILSDKTAVALEQLVEVHSFPKEFITTAWFCRGFSRWYDLITSRNARFGFSKKKIHKYHEALQFLDEFYWVVENMSFDCPSGIERRKPFKCWLLMTTKSIQALVNYFIEVVGFGFLRCGKFTTEGS
jgi:hypothetical protein